MNSRAAWVLICLSLIAAVVGLSVFFGKTDHQGARRGEDILRFHRYGKLMSTTLFDFLDATSPKDSYAVHGVPPGFFDDVVTVEVKVSSGPHTGDYAFVIRPKDKFVRAADQATKELAEKAREWARSKEAFPIE